MVLRPRGVSGGSRLAPPTSAAFHVRDRVGTPMLLISRLNSPACTPPANASPTPLRAPTHGSGPSWSLAFRCRTFPFLVPCRFIPAHHEATKSTKDARRSCSQAPTPSAHRPPHRPIRPPNEPAEPDDPGRHPSPSCVLRALRGFVLHPIQKEPRRHVTS